MAIQIHRGMWELVVTIDEQSLDCYNSNKVELVIAELRPLANGKYVHTQTRNVDTTAYNGQGSYVTDFILLSSCSTEVIDSIIVDLYEVLGIVS